MKKYKKRPATTYRGAGQVLLGRAEEGLKLRGHLLKCLASRGWRQELCDASPQAPEGALGRVEIPGLGGVDQVGQRLSGLDVRLGRVEAGPLRDELSGVREQLLGHAGRGAGVSGGWRHARVARVVQLGKDPDPRGLRHLLRVVVLYKGQNDARSRPPRAVPVVHQNGAGIAGQVNLLPCLDGLGGLGGLGEAEGFAD